MAAKANIVLDQGSTFNTAISLTNDSNGPLDLTGYTVESTAKQWYTSSNVVTITAMVPSPANRGVIELSLSSNTTASMYPGRYVYDVITIDPSGNVTRIVEGILSVTPAVTSLVPVAPAI